MTITKPILSEKYAIDPLADVDIDGIIAPIVRESMESPVLNTAPAQQLFDMLPPELPEQGAPLEEVVAEIDAVVTRYCRRNAHPGFFGYVGGPGLPTDPLAHAMVAALNQNVIGYPGSPGAVTVERTVVRWLRQLSGLPESADGVIVSGGSVANLSALTVALYSTIGSNYMATGAASCTGARPVIIASNSVHFSVQRAALVLGLGVDHVIAVDQDEQFRMCPDSLEQTLDRCAEHHQQPVCVVASAGTTLTGAVDPLEAISRICSDRGIWLHVDAAYGGAGMMSGPLRHKFRGIEMADSLCMDLHKWFYTGFDGSVLLFREPRQARNVFYTRSDYVHFPKDGTDEEHMFFHFSPELSRRFRALPAYLAFRYYGAELLGRNVLQNHECAVYLARLVDQAPDMELICEPDLSICVFRYNPPELLSDPAVVDGINACIRDRLQDEGNFFLSATTIQDRAVLRICIVSHTTRARHIEQLVESVRRIGRSMLASHEAEVDA
jgi:aromatic-L-amino-acid decarboxylase